MSATQPIDDSTPDGLDGLSLEVADLGAELLAVDELHRQALVDALVARHPAHAGSLRRLAAMLAGAEQVLATTFPDVELDDPTEIAGHRVVRRLGAGAFGHVFLCAQEQPVQRDVAIKVLRPGLGDRQTLRRFTAERQLLASLNHPSITQLYDAGTLADGRPFFVMEYVPGQPISTYCRDRALSVDDRLRLFIDLGKGVAYAHGKGIVHRDLKPGNVLVVDTDAGPRPKIIDFGIAKALHATWPDATGRTDAGRVVGTPGYMSPEQAAGQVDAIDDRSDVFALGVMLYELLTGGMPWERTSTTYGEPARPSARISSASAATAEGAPAFRRHLAARLRGDLDWVTLKALAIEPERRYQSVAALVDDLERHRRGATVAAGPPSATYRLRKLLRRHRGAAVVIGASLAAIVTSVAAAYAYGRRLSARADDAGAAAAAALDDATRLVERLLDRANDDRLRQAPRSDELRQPLLQEAVAFYDRFLRDRPADPALRQGRCRTLLTLSDVHWHLGQYQRAGELADEARIEAETLHAAAPDSMPVRWLVADARRRKGRALGGCGQPEAAHVELAAAVAGLESCHASAPDDYAVAYASGLRELASMQASLRSAEDARRSLQRAVEVLEAALRRRPDAAAVRSDLVFAYASDAQYRYANGDAKAAEPLLLRAEDLLPAVVNDGARARTVVHSLLGRIAADRRDMTTAGHRLGLAIAACEEWHAEQPQRLLPRDQLQELLRILGRTQNLRGAFGDASASYGRAVELAEAMVRDYPEDPTRLVLLSTTLRECARDLWDRFRRSDLGLAAAWTQRALEVHDAIAGKVDAHACPPRWQVAALLAAIGDSAGSTDPSAWDEIAATLPADARGEGSAYCDRLVEAHIGVARSRLGRGDAAGAAAAVAAAEAAARSGTADPRRAVEIERLRSSLALTRGDTTAAAAAADAILAARPTWLGKWRAADCLFAAWQRAGREAANADAAAAYRDRAGELYRTVADELRADADQHADDPWFVVPWGMASLRAAAIDAAGGDTAAAAARLRSALPALLAVAADAVHDHWDPAIVAAGQALARDLGVESAGR